MGGGFFLLHFPWGHPRLPLAVAMPLRSPDFPQGGRCCHRRPAAVCSTRLRTNLYHIYEILASPLQGMLLYAIITTVYVWERGVRFAVAALLGAGVGRRPAPWRVFAHAGGECLLHQSGQAPGQWLFC